MSYQIKTQHVNVGEGHHYIVLHDPETGAEHHVMIRTGHDSCPTCGHVKPKDNLGALDLKAIVKEEIGNLEKAKAQTKEWARKHNIPLLKVKA